MAAVLDGIRVLDLSSGPVGGVATMVLGDFGADVIKVEPPGGDRFRGMPHAPAWLRGKRSVTLDLHDAAGRASASRLAEAADVMVATLSRAESSRLGLDYEALARANPRLIYCRITGFGPAGAYADYPGYEGLVAAKSGRMQAFAGLGGRLGPSYAAVPVASHACSQSAVTGILAALYEREQSGRGQLIETSLLQALTLYDLAGLVRSQLARRHPELFPEIPAGAYAPTLNYHPLPTKDGRWLQMGNLLQHLFDNFLVAAGLEDVLADPRYQGSPATWKPDDLEALRERILLHMRSKTAGEWMEIFVADGGVAATEYRTTEQALDDPDLVLNGHVVEWDEPGRGAVRGPGVLARLEETPGSPGLPAHAAGADNDALSSPWSGESKPAASSLAASEPKTRGPLAGVTILEFATIIAAPLGVSILGDLGARIIKVEPVGGDPYRGLGPLGIMASKTNVSKESIEVDLKSDEGRAIIAKLIGRADAVIHNYRPGVPERLGLGYEQCRALNPDIVWVSVNGYGPLGPGAHRPSTHPVPGAAVGGATLQAAGTHLRSSDDVSVLRELAGRLSRANEANPDPNTSVVVASSALLALLAKRRWGIGQRVFVDMLGANAYANADGFIDYAGKPPRSVPDYELHGLCATYRLYAAREGWVFLALVTDAEWRGFCDLVGRLALAQDIRFATHEGRRANDGALSEALAELFATATAEEWEARLAPNGIGCVQADKTTPGDFWLDDAHARDNGYIVEAAHARYGSYLRWGPTVTFHRTPAVAGAGALGGDHTRSILEELGFGDDDIGHLYASGVVSSESTDPLPPP